MKAQHTFSLLLALVAANTLQAQDFSASEGQPLLKKRNPLSTKTQVEVGLGVASPLLNRGSELERSRSLRQNGLSYYQSPEGVRRRVGNYTAPIGWSVSTAFYKPIQPVSGLMLGAAFRLSLTGSEPENAGYEEGYFFNYMSIGPAIKYYPFTTKNLFFKGEVGMSSVLTKNRFLNSSGQQNFFHQFGIGTNASIGMGYSITPFANKQKSIDFQAAYQQFGTRVEVDGIGNDQWNFGSLNAGVALNF